MASVTLQQAFAQVATVLAPVSGFKAYSVDPSQTSSQIEALSSNDCLEFIEESAATVLGLKSVDLIQQLPTLSKTTQKFVINSPIVNDDYSAVLACKDLGFPLLISSNAQESLDFSVLAQLVAKFSKSTVIHFHQDESSTVKQYSDSKLLSTFSDFQGEDLESAFASLKKLTGTLYSEFELVNSSWFTRVQDYFLLLGNQNALAPSLPSEVGLISVKVYRPFNLNKLESLIGSFKGTLQILEQSSLQLDFQPLFLDVLDLLPNLSSVVSSQLLKIDSENAASVVEDLFANLDQETPAQNLVFGKPFNSLSSTISRSAALNEDIYVKLLRQAIPNLSILNNIILNPSPEFALGKFLYEDEQRAKLIGLVEDNLGQFSSSDLSDKFASWLIKAKDGEEVDGSDLVEILSQIDTPIVREVLALKEYFTIKSNWLIGSDKWCFDQGLSTLHQVLSYNKRVKLLIIDSDSSLNRKQGKKNAGLYAMNYGNSYVASVALYSSYSQTLTSLLEANNFKQGPAIVLAYLPHYEDHLEILKDTKSSVDTGYWPLYRYNPFLENDDQFQLDSSFIRNELKEFLDRENRLTLLAARSPKLEFNLNSLNNKIDKKINEKSKQAFSKMLENLGGEPLTIAFASDGGNAENVAKKLGRRGAAKGLKIKLLAMDDLSLEDLQLETNVAFITSTSGQGEFPTNGKQFWEALKSSTVDLANLKFGVFGLGDSKYWPRKEDAHYYNKPGQDLFKKLSLLGAIALTDLGLGDDQDADGFNTGYNAWEPKIWESLGVSVENADEPPPITNEDMKINSNFLRGTIQEGLNDTSTGAISASDQQMTKFHGIYMQDDRDIREQRKKEGLEPAYSFMARVRLPGGISTPAQWLKIDELASKNGNGTFKITTRATFQLHGIVKFDLKETIKEINVALMDTLAACGDVCRNVMCSALPTNSHLHSQLVDTSKIISRQLLPNTTAYHELWLDDLNVERGLEGGPRKIKVGGDTIVDSEPLYGPTYLPRKYKIVLTLPPYNDVDVWAHDVGLIAIVENNNIIGYNVLVGGGMGTTHNNTKTYPRTGSMFGFCPAEDIHIVCEKVMIVQRDHGDRKNRKHARLKYTIDDMGVDVYKSKVEELWGKKFDAPKPFKIDSNIDYFGWCKDELGLNHYTCFIENGRIEDTVERPHKTGLNKIAHYMVEHGIGEFRLTGNQHILLSNIPDEHLASIKSLLKEHTLDNLNFTSLRLSSSSCVALPTCGLAMAEAERYLPVLIDKLEVELENLGLRNDSIVMRMTGCPNGCARPWLAEVALVGKAPGTYNLMLGGGYKGERLNKLFKTNVDEEQIFKILVPMFRRWSLERQEGEHFGDFVIRAGYIKPTLEGKTFWDDLPEDV
ncbi:hypothetical protein OGAPHI_000840 [Ogataea philodendri]|uniref:assimilatory sulfite reductase (NADPH) n=2 Tax=Saccharomycotina TaxID=147537 RepID=A0A9P8PH34_9ASCO|nr:uncharacterized protein OGAPHI_000840 [Ogataea philodendri]KAH3671129.1 hypothetical protein OGAPHI_000840 [Ogataea philodendri]